MNDLSKNFSIPKIISTIHANYLYADGHVENIAAAKLKKKIDSGHNFAEPPEVTEKLNQSP